VDDDFAGFEFDGQASDTIEFTKCVFTGGSSYYWRFNSGHSGTASIDFTGTVVANASVILRSTSDLDGVTFTDCSSFDSNGATLTNCSFTNTKVDTASPAQAGLISDCDFTSGGSGHAIEVAGTAADFTLTDVMFTGYSGTGTDAPIYVNIATGSMTITVIGGTVPTIRTAGATVTVFNSVDVEINGVTEGAQCSIHARAGGPLSDGDEIMNQSANASGVAAITFNYSSDQPVLVRARSSGVIHAAIAEDGGVFTDETDIARNRSTTNDMNLFPATPVITVDRYYFGALEPFEELLVRVGTAGVGTYTLEWQYWNTISNWLTLTTTTADDFKSTGLNYVRFSAPGNWNTTTINGQGPYYFIRVRFIFGTMTTSPLGNNATMDVTKYLPFRQNATITSGCGS
jgi:hypothetical protein